VTVRRAIYVATLPVVFVATLVGMELFMASVAKAQHVTWKKRRG
jgi:hypothetical protein